MVSYPLRLAALYKQVSRTYSLSSTFPAAFALAANKSVLKRPSHLRYQLCMHTGQSATTPISNCITGHTDWHGTQPPNPTREGEAHSARLTPQCPLGISGRSAILGVIPQLFRWSDAIHHLLLHRWGWGGGQRRGWCRRVTRVILGVGWGVVCKMA